MAMWMQDEVIFVEDRNGTRQEHEETPRKSYLSYFKKNEREREKRFVSVSEAYDWVAMV